MDRKQATKELIEMGGGDPKIVLMSKFSPVPYAESLLTKHKFIVDKYKRFWKYDSEDGMWKENAEDEIKHILRNELLGEELQKKNYVDEVVSYIKDISYKKNFLGVLPENVIPFKNVLYDIEKETFIDFSPEYFVTNKIPIEIDNKYTECDIIDSFFEDIVGKEQKKILYDLIAYCLYRSYPYQKLFFLFGAGKNGKSTFLELLREFLGNDNVSSVSPHEICNGDKFALTPMWNKLANISSDISYDVLKNVNKIKEITGGDTVSIRRLYKEAFPARLYAKQIYSTNQIPLVEDKTNAWYRRVYLIEFPNQFDKPDRTIFKKITTNEQLSGLAWKCIKYLSDMKNKNFVFSLDIDEEKLQKLYEELSDPLTAFLLEQTEQGHDEDYIWRYEFKDRFQEWLKNNKKRIWSESEINSEMRKRFSESKKNYSRFGEPDKRYWAWSGVKWSHSMSSKSSMSKGLTTTSLYIDTFYILEDNKDMKDTKILLTRTFNEIIDSGVKNA